MLCKNCVVALVYRVLTGNISSSLTMCDDQPVRCALVFSGLLCIVYRCFVFSLQAAGTLSINDEFLSEKFGRSILSTDPPWSD
jgi:hypothetical protein